MTEINIGRYRHYKGNEYTVIGTAHHSETLEELVVYRQEYGDHGLWVRPKQMFSETVKVEGQEVPRFQPLGSSSEQVGESVKNIFDDLPQHLPKEACPDAHPCRRRAHRADHLARPRIARQTSGTTSRSTNGSIVLKGAARLQFEDGMVEMKPGDFINIPAFKKHRVEWTTPDEPTIWLGVHYGDRIIARSSGIGHVFEIDAVLGLRRISCGHLDARLAARTRPELVYGPGCRVLAIADLHAAPVRGTRQRPLPPVISTG